jgi:hypothetical protein
MKFKDLYNNRDNYFSIGIEEDTGKYYLSIPVSNSFVDYEEYYEIDKNMFYLYPSNLEEIKIFLELCRGRKMDKYLLEQPGTRRGFPVYP